MNNERPKRDSMSLEDATISNVWEIAAIVEMLERTGYNPARQDNRESREADQLTSDPRVGGSSPSGRTTLYAEASG